MLQPHSTASNTIIHDYQLLASFLKSCAALSAIHWGKALHSTLLKMGHLSSLYLSKSLLNMYAKCGAFSDSNKLFGEISNCSHDPIFWNILLSGFAASPIHDAQTFSFFNRMRVANQVKPTSVTAAVILPVCARMRDIYVGKSFHCYMIKTGMETHTLVGNALVSMYAKCGLVSYDAYAAFQSIYHKDVVSWNAIIAGFSENKMVDSALRLFFFMLKTQIKPNHATIATVLPLLASLATDTAYLFGREIHCYILRHNESLADVSVCNALLSFHLMVGRVKEAELLFRRMELRDLISWNAIISGFASNGEWSKSLELFQELLYLESNEPDSVTLVSILPACAQLQNLKAGREIHSYVLRHPYLYQDTSVGNALVSFYAKCNNLVAAYHTFLMIPSRDLISWNSMLDAFAIGGRNAQFFKLLHWMHTEGIRPDSITILTILHFCANVLKVDKVKETHCYSLRCGLLQSDFEPTTRNAMLDTYAKCSNVEYAFKVFQTLSDNRNLVTFNSMISGYVNCGLYDDAYMIFEKMPASDLTTWNLMVRGCAENDCPDQAFSLFRELQARGMKPDAVTIISLLPSCAQTASVHLMKQCHGYVIRACFDDAHLEGALLDLYAKCGDLGYAFKLFHSNPGRDLVVFTAMVGGYAMHGMGEEALRIFSDMLDLGIKPDHIVITAVLSACCHAGLVDEGLKIFHSIEKVHGMRPTMEQYSCAVDLLARGGQIDDAYSLLTKMPVEANANVWGALLGACRIHHEVELGHAVAQHLFKIEANNIGNYVVLSNLFAADARWDEVMEIRKQMRMRDLKKPAGCSWIEVERRKNVFVAGDSSHPQRCNIYSLLSTLDLQIKEPFQLNQLPETQLLECYK
ncbi:putative pentatricopeptide repeat-containing protein At5g08490 [Ricinus communis]|uniref:putative pentatricopeptide repeat-containing protein At5g08490 n=1 Tax=Ricinus communis TaxID=3988 RepID=UPI0007728651|nr:putative pentatricopeptide repeat-containing protein At5g08490 [Ricinus communis]XP_048233086.1 putative pentatricopeptide repeat-containing protein At5g08490 [Ricinus communis]XP_048233087.1 putative pentatricopeptide repeat-containing protein At5g08490 [Ricinus communis]XP_048233088.1 putative pentatricopeptide repeat-containing protein At5g08490 [Ricinus communis]XP_048233089.1 putative pentatricopeptide repeat-containing protein At5g08490 [Ricinus communis]|eukprot:XP_025012906.1 putative pentatricopeptide repeat-containing protein At5g08490 [Ricinus communis]